MKTLAISALIFVSALSFAQEFPVETEATRKPNIQTGGNVLIRHGRVLTVTKGTLEDTDVLILKGKIAKIGRNLAAPSGTAVIDATGKVVSPGIVDAHVHRGILDTNEGTDSIVPEVRIRDVLNPNAKSLWQALAGGETTGMALHGSANCIGGESVVIKFKYRRPVEELPVSTAPRMVKFALGENVTRSGSTTPTRFPRTRMGVQALYRRAFSEAKDYMASFDRWEKGGRKGDQPRKDIRLDALSDILRKKIWVQCHSYRADEMLMMVRLSQEFGFKIGAMQHALEAYKIAPDLAKAGVGVSIFVDNWSFKVEGYDAIPFNASICTKAGVNVSINTDGTGGMPSIATDAAKVMRWGGLSEQQALSMITINPAKELGIANRVGSIEVGKDGDVVIWNGHPLSVYSRCDMTLIEGEPFFQAKDSFGLNKSSTFKTVLDANKKTPPLNLAANPNGYVIRGATIHRVSAPSQVGDVFLKNGKIAAIGAKLSVPVSVSVVNGAGLHVYPGFIDAGGTMGLAEISGIGQMVDTTELGGVQPDLIAATAIQPQSEHFPVARMGGVLTTVTRPSGGTIPGQASLINTFGWTTDQMALGPRMLVVNIGGGGGGGFGAGNDDDCCGEDESAKVDEYADLLGGQGFGGGGGGAQTAEDVEKAIDEAKAYFAKRASDPSTPTNLGFEAMRGYLSGKSKVLIRVTNASSIRRAVQLAGKYKLDAVLFGATEAWKETKLLKEKNIPVIITAAGKSTLNANSPPNDWDPFDTPFAQGALLKKAGVKFCYQVDASSDSHLLAVKVGESCAYGLSRDDALRAITLSAAEILGVSNMLGSIDVGKTANVVITDGDPSELTTNIVAVFVNGHPRALVSKFTRLRDQWSAQLNDK